jgi:hypothetical protein
LFTCINMQEYRINVTKIEELQMVKNTRALDRIFKDAKETIVSGEAVWLMRKQHGVLEKFDELTTTEDLEGYKKSVYKYI